MHNLDYSTVEDFVFDESFRKWVLKTADEEVVLFWEQWALDNADKYEILSAAKSIIYSLTTAQDRISESDIEIATRKIMAAVHAEAPHELTAVSLPGNAGFENAGLRFRYWLKIAAAVLIIFSGIAYWYQSHSKGSKASYEEFYSVNEKSIIEFSNNTDAEQLVNLPDGSTAKLSARSKLSYTLKKDTVNKINTREIFLEGECFFSVHRNTNEPFFVYTSTIVTKVLGTSFKVRAYSGDANARIEVHTGKVSVYRKQDLKNKATTTNELGGLLLLPNQQVTYNAATSALQKSLVKDPIIISPRASEVYSFDAAPYTEVFKKLEQDYGIEIIYNEDAVANCTLTATFGNEGFNDIMRLICKSINARFESIDGNIVVYADGCK